MVTRDKIIADQRCGIADPIRTGDRKGFWRRDAVRSRNNLAAVRDSASAGCFELKKCAEAACIAAIRTSRNPAPGGWVD